jgi:hypothetical protein
LLGRVALDWVADVAGLVGRVDVVPEGVTAGGGGAPDIRPPEVPWSELGPDFLEAWGHDDKGKVRAEHWEVEGQSGSGKSYLIATALQQRAARWGTAEVGVITKNTDDSIPLLGWPVAATFEEARKYRWSLFWPQTRALGEDREAHHEQAIYGLLSKLWPAPGEQANIVLYFDEIRYLESLSRRLKKLIRQYWREGRSHGISLIAGSQRPLEMVRDMHSEARWKAVFCPADEADMERFAELLGPARDWEPVLRSLDQRSHQFVLKNTFTGDAYITWVDEELRPVAAQADQKPANDHTPAKAPYGKKQQVAA